MKRPIIAMRASTDMDIVMTNTFDAASEAVFR
jgi:hypothetical protein